MRHLVLPALFVPLLAVGCSGDGGSTPTAPAAPQLELASAEVVVDGRAAIGGVVYCQYERPGGMGMHGRGTFALYDDGTHGDGVPNDGLYCFEDDRAEYGCHGDGAGPGDYHYEFWGRHAAFGESAHRRVTITVR